MSKLRLSMTEGERHGRLVFLEGAFDCSHQKKPERLKF
jgi:hypothetical protein